MNYGEELAYWYLRFNGFFPLTNFVLHPDELSLHPSDCDLLAMRHPFVHEDIGGQPDDWDDKLTNKLDFNKTIGLICEVKTGRHQEAQVLPFANTLKGIRRLGFFPEEIVGRVAQNLASSCLYEDDEHQIVKLLIADKRKPRSTDHHFVPLIHTRAFLKARIIKYINPKFGQRFFFQSSLLQELIWEVKRKLP